jgi:hypothetical protein
MPTAYRPLSNVSNYAALDSSATGALTRGMALAVVSWPTGSTDLPKVKGCADGTRPDGVVLDAIDLGATGRFAPRCAASSAVILGGSVMAGDLLKVSAGKWVKCSPADQGWMRAMQIGAAGDLVNAEPADKTA